MTKKRTMTAGIGADLRVGYVPLVDAAPLMVGAACGLFAAEGLRVSLRRELGWATIRDKMVYGELDAAQAVAGMPFAVSQGWGCPPLPCVAPLVLNLHGNAVTFSTRLVREGAANAEGLARLVRGTARRPVFGVVSPFSSHRFLLSACLGLAGLREGADFELVVVPPPLMVRNLKAGTIDGFCAGEPWNSVAVQEGAGRVVATSPELAMGHPEKVLMVRADTAQRQEQEVGALVRALAAACRFCDGNPRETAKILASREHLDLPAGLIEQSLRGCTGDHQGRRQSNLHVFSRYEANRPDWNKADWVLRNMVAAGLVDETVRQDERRHRKVFREDLYDRALAGAAPVADPAPPIAA